MPYALEPLVAGELGEGTVLDPSTHPPKVSAVDYVLDRAVPSGTDVPPSVCRSCAATPPARVPSAAPRVEARGGHRGQLAAPDHPERGFERGL
jgi:hypothetical protein